jgi:hypothetical protein
MRFRVSFIASFLAVAFLALATGVQAQDQSTTPKPVANGTYIVVDPLAGVRYDNRYDLSLGLAYDHMKAGPTLLQGSNLGGLDLSGSYWLLKHWGLEGSARGYVGTSGAGVNDLGIQGPFVSQYLFVAGPSGSAPTTSTVRSLPTPCSAESTENSSRTCLATRPPCSISITTSLHPPPSLAATWT